jgi:hypothetical protein
MRAIAERARIDTEVLKRIEREGDIRIARRGGSGES